MSKPFDRHRDEVPRLFTHILSLFMVLVLLLASFAAGIYFYLFYRAQKDFQSGIEENLASAVKVSSESVNAAYISGRQVLNHFYVQSNLKVYSEAGISDRILMIKISVVLKDALNYSSLIDEIFLINEPNVVFNTEGMAESATFFRELYQFETTSASPEAWSELLTRTPGIYTLTPSNVYKPYSTWKAVRILPFATVNYVNGRRTLAVVNLNLDLLGRDLGALLSYDDSLFAIARGGQLLTANFDADEALLSLHGGKVKIGGSTYYVHACGFTTIDWQCLLFVPQSRFASEYGSFLTASLAVCLVMTLLGTLLAFFLTWRIYSPMNRIFDLTRTGREDEPNRPMSGISGRLEKDTQRLVTRYMSMAQRMSRQLICALRLYLLQDGEEPALIDDVRDNFEMAHSRLVCIALRLHPKRTFFMQHQVDQNVLLEAIQAFLERSVLTGMPSFAVAMERDVLAVFVNLEPDRLDALRQLLIETRNVLDIDFMYYSVAYAISQPVAVRAMRLAYQQARTALEYARSLSLGPYIEAGALQIASGYSLSDKDLRKLTQCAKAGDTENLRLTVRSLLQKNLETPVCYLQMIRLAQTLALAVAGQEAEDAPCIGTDPALWEEQIVALCPTGSEVPAAGNLVKKVQQYVQANLSQSLSLGDISRAVGYQPKYLSRIFKQLCGDNLSDYVNKIRIQEACRLLRQTDWTIERIQEAVGIPSRTTFMRVFKKFEGIPPGRYKQINGTEQAKEVSDESDP